MHQLSLQDVANRHEYCLSVIAGGGCSFGRWAVSFEQSFSKAHLECFLDLPDMIVDADGMHSIPRNEFSDE
jgi:hypothetical protein